MISQNRDHQASWEGAEGVLVAIQDKPSLIRIGGILNVLLWLELALGKNWRAIGLEIKTEGSVWKEKINISCV